MESPSPICPVPTPQSRPCRRRPLRGDVACSYHRRMLLRRVLDVFWEALPAAEVVADDLPGSLWGSGRGARRDADLFRAGWQLLKERRTPAHPPLTPEGAHYVILDLLDRLPSPRLLHLLRTAEAAAAVAPELRFPGGRQV